jgi:hypothetical protein
MCPVSALHHFFLFLHYNILSQMKFLLLHFIRFFFYELAVIEYFIPLLILQWYTYTMSFSLDSWEHDAHLPAQNKYYGW